MQMDTMQNDLQDDMPPDTSNGIDHDLQSQLEDSIHDEMSMLIAQQMQGFSHPHFSINPYRSPYAPMPLGMVHPSEYPVIE